MRSTLSTLAIRECWSRLSIFSPILHTTRRFAHRSCGIVGLPNTGKSTLFNALTQTQLAEASNYPFTTIEPNTAYVSVVDARLNQLAAIVKSAKVITAQITFVDIAGLIKGASAGAGLGNKFLSNIREVSVILHVVRCYDNPDVVHVSSRIDPIDDMATIEEELLLDDVATVEKRLEIATRKSRGTGGRTSGTESAETYERRVAVLNKLRTVLDKGVAACDVVWPSEDIPFVSECQLLTDKPMAIVCNVDETNAATGNAYSQRVVDHINAQSAAPATEINGLTVKRRRRRVMHVCAQLESDAVSGFDTAEARREFLSLSSLNETSLDRVITESSELLGVQQFYTVGPTESRAWQIKKGCTAVDAAGCIHSDFARGFIAAEVIKPNDLITLGSEAAVRAAGRLSTEGKTYIVQDGDIILFRFNVSRSNKDR